MFLGVPGESIRSDLVRLGLVVVPPPWIGQRGCVSSAMLVLRRMSWLKLEGIGFKCLVFSIRGV